MPALFVAFLTVTVVVAVAAGSAAAATPAVGEFAVSPEAAVARWTPVRRAAAEPIGALELPRPERGGGAALRTAGASDAVYAASPSAVAAAPTGTAEGVDTGDPTLFPNRANGTVYGEYATSEGIELYQCSGSVIDSPAGNVVLTAGHCVIDPETGEVARSLVFVPGYRETAEPYGAFAAESWVTTPEWEATAGTVDPDEAGDLAMLVLAPGAASGISVEATVGALSIAFERPREATYTQWGYPGEAPYDGEVLLSHTTPYAGVDSFYPAATAPIKIASDFTAGASGGPWTIGPATDPTVVSLTDYFYEYDPRHVYGAWFGAAARQAYEAAAGVGVAPVTTGAGEVVPNEPSTAPTPVAPPATAPAPGASAPAPSGVAAAATGRLRVRTARGPSGGDEATLVVNVDGPGTLRLTGAAVRTASVEADAGGGYRMAVNARPGSAAARALRHRGTATVGVWIRFISSAGVRQAWRLVHLTDPRRLKPRLSHQPTPRSDTE